MGRLRQGIVRYFSESSLHGLKYTTDPKSSKFKSYFWAVVFLISLCLCFVLIKSQFNSYQANRITTTIATTSFPIWEVPFPAVTLCNFNLVHKDNIEPFRKILMKKISTEEINNFFSNLSSLIISSVKTKKEIKWADFFYITKILQKEGYDTDKLMRALMQPCDKLVTSCYWGEDEMNCTEIFTLIKTTRGYCCSLNHKGVKMPNSKDDGSEEPFVPGVGPSFGLHIHLDMDEDQYISAFDNKVGIDVAVHQKISYPDISTYSTAILPGTDISMSVTPQIIESDPNLRNIDIETRHCAFESEIKMEWDSRYTYNACVNECKAKAILRLCGCVPYFYYPIKGRRVKYCTLLDMVCVTKNDIKFKGTKITYSRDNAARKQILGRTVSCECYPQCNELTYTYRLDQKSLKLSELPTNESILRVYFAHVGCMKLVRNVFITWELILASVGGLIGLCLGGSILSIIEFFYTIFEIIFSRYKTKPDIKSGMKNYQPKLYLSDFRKTKNPTFRNTTIHYIKK